MDGGNKGGGDIEGRGQHKLKSILAIAGPTPYLPPPPCPAPQQYFPFHRVT